ncbi:von Willebrand factor type A domain-containing protein [Xylaria bambusicola]|uniref:von Willebrand factor type A domain-containing protein n=1 Tax=Xylaria bambusicola TaxID=326684 RepID=UPI0020083F51|nr:von Willebrand factor type A domain-containing protein [Xylaria bambusicola]KAI0517045.1 von Willebrand factor type A domain-containing protein [Xylaria bambusicola]
MARAKQTARVSRSNSSPLLIGCWHPIAKRNSPSQVCRSYLPLSSLRAHTIITDVVSRTRLTQSFSNMTADHLANMVYSFPIYDGVSVVSFTAIIGDVQIQGIVKDKQQANLEFKKAVAKGESAALLEQLPQASDVFTTHIGNVPAGNSVTVELVYIGELRHDAEADGSRFTIPLSIAPRYGNTPDNLLISPSPSSIVQDAIQITVDVQSPSGCPIQTIQSPSHPVAVSMGRTTDMHDEAFVHHRASATLSLNYHSLDKDFVIIINTKNANVPRAILETHPTIPHQRALLVSLVPTFQLQSGPVEIVFIIDRSGSMKGKIGMVIEAMNTMLKSLNAGAKFNICSFGSRFSFMWPQSKQYNEHNLDEALQYVGALQADYGGTEMLDAVRATISQRDHDLALNAIILTDGQIWRQEELFKIIRESSEQDQSRFFALGIGHEASTSLVQGIATEGNGMSQFVADGESMDTKLVRLLKCALSPYLGRYSLDTKYKRDDEDYEIIESKDASMVTTTLPMREKRKYVETDTPDITNNGTGDETDAMCLEETKSDRFSHLPRVSAPSVLQVPSQVPPLYPFSRTTFYLLLDPSTYSLTPESVILQASSKDGQISMEIEVEDVGKGETIHQLAAKKAVSELEMGRGWLRSATDRSSNLRLKTQHEAVWDEIVQREAIHLGTKYQVAGKWCSFIAVKGDEAYEPITFRGLARMSKAPRKQLANHAARKSAPSTTHPKAVASQSFKLAENPVEDDTSPSLDLAKSKTLDKMHALIRLQKFDGSWRWEQSLLEITGAILSKAKAPVQEDSILATALAIAFLRTRMAHSADAWELIVDKAVLWLTKQESVDNTETEIQRATMLIS